MNKIYAFVTLFLSAASLSAQINVQWETRFTTAGANNDILMDMEVDAAGFVYVTGSSFNATGTGSGFDIVTRRYDNNGNVLWTSVFNGDGNGMDQASALAVDNAGNSYVTGFSFRGGTNYDFITIKYDVNGVEQWALYNGSSFYDEGRDITVDGNGDIIVTGGVQAAANNTNYRTIKYSPTGVQLWFQDFSSSGSNLDLAIAVVCDNNNNVYVTGHAFQSGQDLNIRTIKYAPNGTQLYNTQHQLSTINSLDSPTSIAVNSAGEAFVCGRSFNGSATDDDIVVLKYNAAGTVVSTAVMNGTADAADKANKVVLDPFGNVYVAGRLKNVGTAEDFTVIKFNSALVHQWTYNYNGQGANYDEARDLAFDVSGEVYATGYSFLPSSNNDFVTVRLNLTTGQPSWLTRFNGTANNNDQAKVIRVDAVGNVYVSGESNGAGSGKDYSTIKYCQHTTEAGLDENICIGSSVQLNATGGVNFNWSPSTGLNQTNIPNPIATPSVTTTYIVTSESLSGCVDADTITVVVNPLPGPVIGVNGSLSICVGDSVELFSVDPYPDYTWSTGATSSSIFINQPGTYSLTVVDAMGCNNNTEETVVVNPLPTISAGSDAAICIGDDMPLLATGGVSYQWQYDISLSSLTVADPIAEPLGTTTYVVFGTDANGCVNSDTVTVVVNPLPFPPNIIRLDPNLVTNNSTGNQWYLNGAAISGATGQTHTFIQNGDYWVTYTDVNGCSSSSDTISILDVGVDEWGVSIQAQVFPNPGNGQYQLLWTTSITKTVIIEVVDMQGRLVYSANELIMNGVLHHVDITNQANGMYLLRVLENNNQIGSIKLVKR
jgi:uncharacterized delta-60 repeat protein